MKEEEYSNYVEAFNSDGWKQFMDIVVDNEKNLLLASVDGADTGDKWQYLRGQVSQLRGIMGFPNYIESVWQQSQQDNEDEDTI